MKKTLNVDVNETGKSNVEMTKEKNNICYVICSIGVGLASYKLLVLFPHFIISSLANNIYKTQFTKNTKGCATCIHKQIYFINICV